MKHCINLLFSLLVMASVACTRDESSLVPPAGPDSAPDGYAVTVEEALTNLDNELAMIYGGDETRSAYSLPRVKSVRSINYDELAPVTRSSAVPDDIDDLVYVVEFAEGGSAVLGADKRVDPVLAILDETVLTPEDFISADRNSDDLTSYVASLIADGAVGQAGASPQGSGLGDQTPVATTYRYIKDTVNVRKQSPLLKTKWHQGSPYNDMYKVDMLGHNQAGCGVIAVAQVLKYNEYPDNITISGDMFNWSLLRGCHYGVTQSYASKVEVARFVYRIGDYMNVDNGGTHPIDAFNMFKHVGYKSVNLTDFSYPAALRMILDNKLAFFMRGEHLNAASGHVWVVDGLNAYDVEEWEITYDTTGIQFGRPFREISRQLLSTTNIRKVHCNFGWGGLCDGYYTYNLFDTTKRLSADDIDGSVGDYSGIAGYDESYIYNTNFKMITYSLQ